MQKKVIVLFILSCFFKLGYAQSNLEIFQNKLEELSQSKKELNESIRIDLTGLPLYDFITTVAEEYQINVSVDRDLNDIVTSNFFDVNVKEVFMFLIKKHNLDVEVVGNIMVFRKKEEEPKKEVAVTLKPIDITYNNQNNFLSVKLKNDSLPRVAEAITNASNKNVILSPDIKGQKVSAYILNRPFDQVMEMLAKSNSMVLTKDENDNYFLEKNNAPPEVTTTNNARNRRNRNNSKASANEEGSYEVGVDAQGFLDIKSFEGDATALITEAAEKLGISFFMYNTPDGINTTLIAKGLTFDDLLDHLFKGEIYTYKKVDDLYLIGEHTTEGLRSTELVQLENRTIETVLTSLPTALTQNLEIKEFVELNGFVVSGSKIQIDEFKDFIHQIDRVVPVVQIEVIIVQYQKGYEIQTGLQAGIDSQQRTTSGVLFPTSDVSLNSTSVNNLIDAFNGLGFINLGKVTENFYLNLQALENNSIIKLSSTPKLVTLNGHEANSTIGETSYYFEQSNQLIARGINDNILQSGTWKSTEANLSITINPTVSKDENVTLDIAVERSSFLGRAGENAPPGKATQQFQSLIRVKNNEMILLGGLDELENENSGTGTPFFSRIPIIKWFFSSRKKRKEKSKLHIFIKPTVTY
ncbi:type II and III secretion system protein [Winogradskyella sp. 3972H.M.0a.05]|uniref:type II secretion system protein GspD n=1 Tax=Winogradskyella sp. 3972H.M.0a.05 TaxID=2950277 RepID=UPI00339A858E